MKKKLLSLFTMLLSISSSIWAAVPTPLSPVSFNTTDIFASGVPASGTSTLVPDNDAGDDCVGTYYLWQQEVAEHVGKPNKMNLVFWYKSSEKQSYTINGTVYEFPPCGDYVVYCNGTSVANTVGHCKPGYVTGVGTSTTISLYVNRWEWAAAGATNYKQCKFYNEIEGNHYIQVRKGTDGPYIYFQDVKSGTSSAPLYFEGVTVGTKAADADDMVSIEVVADDASKGSVTGSTTINKYFWTTITATPNPGEAFYGWSDGDQNQTRRVMVSEAKTYTALFTPGSIVLPKTTIQSNEHATIVAMDGVNAIAMNEEYEAANGTEITLSITPNDNYRFKGWYKGDILLSEESSYTYQVNGTQTISARVVPFTVDVIEGFVPVNCYNVEIEGQKYDRFKYYVSSTPNIIFTVHYRNLNGYDEFEFDRMNDLVRASVWCEETYYGDENPVKIIGGRLVKDNEDDYTISGTFLMEDGTEHDVTFHYHFYPNYDNTYTGSDYGKELVNYVSLNGGGENDFYACDKIYTEAQTTYGESYVEDGVRKFPVTCTQTDGDGVTWTINMMFIADENATTLPAGNYTINSSGEAGTVLAPAQPKTNRTSPSYFMYEKDEMFYYAHFVNGTVTVTEGEEGSRGTVTINGRSVGYQPITASFPAPAAPQQLEIVLNDNEDNAAKLLANKDQEANITINRTFQTGMWNTVCLPFDLSVGQIANVFGVGTKVGRLTKAYTEIEDGENTLFLDFNTTVTAMTAGDPYIILPGSNVNIVNPCFEGVTISVTSASEPVVEEVVFVGLFSPTTETLTETDYFLGANNTIHPTASGSIKGFRAYFAWTPATPAPRRARMVTHSTETTTNNEVISADEIMNTKYVTNGRLVIIIDGTRYDATGQLLQ